MYFGKPFAVHRCPEVKANSIHQTLKFRYWRKTYITLNFSQIEWKLWVWLKTLLSKKSYIKYDVLNSSLLNWKFPFPGQK